MDPFLIINFGIYFLFSWQHKKEKHQQQSLLGIKITRESNDGRAIKALLQFYRWAKEWFTIGP